MALRKSPTKADPAKAAVPSKPVYYAILDKDDQQSIGLYGRTADDTLSALDDALDDSYTNYSKDSLDNYVLIEISVVGGITQGKITVDPETFDDLEFVARFI